MKKNSSNNVSSLRDQAIVTGTHEAELFSNDSMTSSQIARAAAELGQAGDTI